MAGRCKLCPLAGYSDAPCAPARDWPGWCGRIERDAHQPEHARYWEGALLREAAKLAGPDFAALPTAFPRKDVEPGKVRVGMIAPCLHMGGAEAWQLTLARTTAGDRIQWMGCAVTGGEADITPMMRAATERHMPVAHGRHAARRLAQFCDVVVLWAIHDVPGILAGLESPPKVICTCHSPLESGWGPVRNAVADGIDAWVGVSALAVEAIPEAVRAAVPVATIENAVDESRMMVGRSRDDMHRLWGIPAGAKVAGFLGRLSKEKDPAAMCRAIEHLPEPWHSVLVGRGAEIIDPHPRLHCVGNDPAAGDVLNAFDVLVCPSAYESYGLTMVEGLWAGVPVVSTAVGIEKIHPGLTYRVPIDAEGETLAAAVVAAFVGGPRPGSREWARDRASGDRFGREWTNLILSLAPAPKPVAKTFNPPPAKPGIDPVVRDAVLNCSSRGGILPLAEQPQGCGCRGDSYECKAGKGKVAGRVFLTDCLACKG